MMKYGIILMCSVVITSIHRFWNNAPVHKISLFLISDIKQDVQWYIKDTFDMISGIMVIWVLWDVMRKLSARVADIVMLIMIYKLMNFAGYWINFNTYDYMFVYAIIPIGLILLLVKK